MPHLQNRLLARLDAKVYAALEPHLKTQPLKIAEIIGRSGDSVQKVFFPHSGVISLVVELSVGMMIETAMVGLDGAVNGASALDGKISLNKAIVQIEGVTSTVDVKTLRKVALANEELLSLLVRHEQVVLAQAQQAAACNASHSVESRMCRWLLRIRDLVGGDDLVLTQEFLAQMLGVRRPTVSVVAHTLQKAGFIRYSRGHIRLLNVEGLQEGSCECYEAVNGHYKQMLA
jgi:CRP-like cAMP-binding protein